MLNFCTIYIYRGYQYKAVHSESRLQKSTRGLRDPRRWGIHPSTERLQEESGSVLLISVNKKIIFTMK